MAARLRKTHQEDVRAKIRTSCILKALDEHVHGERELTSAQVASAKILLDKSMSNAPTINELSGPGGNAIPIGINVSFR